MAGLETPNANRLHIGIYGKRNSGKSTLLNRITKQNIAVVSPHAGTTTDPVYKAMELADIGPVIFYDTAGFDDVGELGELRVEKTREIIEKTDIAILLFREEDISLEVEWYQALKAKHIPVLILVNQEKKQEHNINLIQKIEQKIQDTPVVMDIMNSEGSDSIREHLLRLLPQNFEEVSIIGHLVKEDDVVLLVMPQDIQAPKGRLILPQVQTIRDLLDHKCIVQSCTTDMLEKALKSLAYPPKLIITDSQVFKKVVEQKPKESLITSFSVLFAKYKGDIDYFMESARVIGSLDETSRVLIAEACTHAPLAEDIGRVKIPALLRKKAGNNITIDMVSGMDFPEDIMNYDLIIHCGACMFNRKHVLGRVDKAKRNHVPMTNYGVAIAFMNGILDMITI